MWSYLEIKAEREGRFIIEKSRERMAVYRTLAIYMQDSLDHCRMPINANQQRSKLCY